jgi:hypothetical protein
VTTRAYMLTRASARAAGACYSDARVAALVPPGGLSPAEVAALDIPPDDRVWALVSACGATREMRGAFARMCEDRAVDFAAAALKSATADRAIGAPGADAAADVGRAASAASIASYTAVAHARDAYAGVFASVTARSAAKAAASAAAAAAWADVAAGTTPGIDVEAAAAAGRLAEQQWQLDTLVELLSHTHPQIEG